MLSFQMNLDINVHVCMYFYDKLQNVVFFINFIDLPSILHIRIYDLFIPTLLTDQTSLM